MLLALMNSGRHRQHTSYVCVVVTNNLMEQLQGFRGLGPLWLGLGFCGCDETQILMAKLLLSEQTVSNKGEGQEGDRDKTLPGAHPLLPTSSSSDLPPEDPRPSQGSATNQV